MEINPNRSVDPLAPAVGPAKAKETHAAEQSEASFHQCASLDSALASTPDCRADVVAKAEKLISSPNYPPPEVIKRIANLLAASLISTEN